MSVTPPVAQLPPSLMQQGISPRQIVAVLWAYWKWIVLVTIVVATIAVLLSKFVLQKTYVARATLQVDFQVYDPATGQEFPSYLAPSYMATQLELLNSRKVMLRAVQVLGWEQDPEKTEGYEAGSGATVQDYLAEQLAEAMSVSQARDSRLIHVSFESDSAEGAARAANAIAQVYVEESQAISLRPSQERAGQYSQQLEQLKARVEDAQRDLSQYTQDTGLIDLDRRSDAESDRLNELGRRLVQAESESQTASLRLQQAGRLRAGEGALDSDTEILGSNVIQSMKAELGQLLARRAELSDSLGRRHPEMVALNSRIDVVQRRLDAELETYVANIRNQARLAAEQEAALRRAVEAQRSKVLDSRRVSDEASSLTRELAAAEKVYNASLDGYEKLLIGSQGGYSNISILSPASPPLLHDKPKTRVNAILGVFFGGFLGVATAILWELRERRIRCRDDIERDLGLPVLAELVRPRR